MCVGSYSKSELFKHFDHNAKKHSDVCMLLADCENDEKATKWEIIGKDVCLYDGQNIQTLSQLLNGQHVSLVFASFDPGHRKSVIAFERTCFLAGEMDIPVCSISTVKEEWVSRMATYLGAARHFEGMPTRTELARLVRRHSLN